MNIFVTSACPIECAKALDDKRCIKMCLETAQLLSTAMREHGYCGDKVYKSTHRNHPSAVWVRSTRQNYRWTLRHFAALCREYSMRFNRVHKSSLLVTEFSAGVNLIPAGKLLPFANCAANASLGLSYKEMSCTFTAYQLYLNDRWGADKRTPTWYGKAA